MHKTHLLHRQQERDQGSECCSSAGFSPRLGEVGEVHLGDEAPVYASVVAVLQQHSFLPAVRLITLGPVSAHPQVELHKLRPFSVQVPAQQLPQPSLTTHTHMYSDMCGKEGPKRQILEEISLKQKDQQLISAMSGHLEM